MATDAIEQVENALAKADRVPAERSGEIAKIAHGIDIASSTDVLNFGAESEKALSDFANSVLERVMSKDTGPVHAHLSEIKMVASGLSVDGLKERRGFFARLFYNAKRELAKFTDRFNTARQQIDAIARKLEDQVNALQIGLVTMDKLFEQSVNKLGRLNLYIKAGHQALEHHRTVTIAELEAEAAAEADEGSKLLAAQHVRDARAGIDRLDRKVMNLEKSRAIAIAMLPTIRQAQQSSIVLIEELKMAISHAIPVWKSTMVLHIEQLRQARGLQTLAAMRDFTDSQLEAMARQLDENVTGLHEQTKHGIAHTEAIVETMASLIQTIDKVEALERDAAQSRRASREALIDAERNFRDRLADGGDAAAQ